MYIYRYFYISYVWNCDALKKYLYFHWYMIKKAMVYLGVFETGGKLSLL